MRRSKILLEFTSLLDIMMILLFAFMMHSDGSAQKEIEKAVNEKNVAFAQIEQREEQLEADRQKFDKEKEEWEKQAEKELEMIKKADEKAAAYAEALKNFQNGVYFEMELKTIDEHNWNIIIDNGNGIRSEISLKITNKKLNKDIKNEIITFLNDNGFEKNDVIIAIFRYNPHDKGSTVVREIIPQINEVQDTYVNFCCTNRKM